MRAAVKGPRIPLAAAADAEQGAPLSGLLIVTVRLSDATRPVRLMLDSGANARAGGDNGRGMNARH